MCAFTEKTFQKTLKINSFKSTQNRLFLSLQSSDATWKLWIIFTWTLDSGRLIFRATSSRMKMSGYLVLANRASRTSSWERVKVVRSRLCFLGVAAHNNQKIYIFTPFRQSLGNPIKRKWYYEQLSRLGWGGGGGVGGSYLGTRLKGAAGPWQRCSAPGRWRRRGAVWGRTSCYRRSLLHPAQASGSLSPGAAAWRDRGPVQVTAHTRARRRYLFATKTPAWNSRLIFKNSS